MAKYTSIINNIILRWDMGPYTWHFGVNGILASLIPSSFHIFTILILQIHVYLLYLMKIKYLMGYTVEFFYIYNLNAVGQFQQ